MVVMIENRMVDGLRQIEMRQKEQEARWMEANMVVIENRMLDGLRPIEMQEKE